MPNRLPGNSAGGNRNQGNCILNKYDGIQFHVLLDSLWYDSQQVHSIEIYNLQLKH